MTEWPTYRFRIGPQSPRTMPFDRLLAYLEQFKRLVPDASRVHLVDVEEGSTQPAFFVEPDYEDTFRKELKRAVVGEGVDRQTDAVAEINYLAGEDGFPAEIRSPSGAKIIEFPGAERPAPDTEELLTGISEPMTIFALPYKAGKATPKANKYQVWMTDFRTGHTIPKAFASIEVGQRICAHMERYLAVTGIAQLIRSEDGQWSIGSFDVTGFREFTPQPASDVFEELRNIEHFWPEDFQETLTNNRETD